MVRSILVLSKKNIKAIIQKIFVLYVTEKIYLSCQSVTESQTDRTVNSKGGSSQIPKMSNIQTKIKEQKKWRTYLDKSII